MRLYLSSHRPGDSAPELLAMVEAGARCAVISNALDFIPDLDRQSYARTVHDPVADFRGHGLDAFDLDLRDHFGAPQALAARLRGVGLVWATGGNAFLLRRAMRQSGFDTLIGPLLAADALVYGGWSAGAVVACPDLRGIDLIDDPHQLAEGYDPAPVYDGLNLIALHLVPHYESDHPESEAAGMTAAYLLDQALPYRTLQDGDVLIRDAAGIRVHEAKR
jgi:dipeptidase E